MCACVSCYIIVCLNAYIIYLVELHVYMFIISIIFVCLKLLILFWRPFVNKTRVVLLLYMSKCHLLKIKLLLLLLLLHVHQPRETFLHVRARKLYIRCEERELLVYQHAGLNDDTSVLHMITGVRRKLW